MNQFRLTDMMEGARNCAINWGNVKAGEDILIITDTNTDLLRVEAIAAVCREVGARVSTVVMPAHDLPNIEPPAPIAAAMKSSDCIFAPLSLSISHTHARNEAVASGARYMGMYGTADELTTPGARFPAEIIYELTKIVSDQWRAGKRIHITCSKGTDISGEMKPHNVVGWEATTGPLGSFIDRNPDISDDRKWLAAFGNFASGFGVVGVWPEWTAEGVVYFDAAHTFPGRLRTPLKYTVEAGRVTNIEGDSEQVEFLQGIIKRFGPDAAHFSEFMIGMNPKARVNVSDGTHLEAHRKSGSLHCAIGNSIEPEMSVMPGIHLDNLILKPTIYIDDEPCVLEGHLVALDRPEIQAMAEEYGVTLDPA